MSSGRADPPHESQEAMFRFLADPKTHKLSKSVERVDTANAVEIVEWAVHMRRFDENATAGGGASGRERMGGGGGLGEFERHDGPRAGSTLGRLTWEKSPGQSGWHDCASEPTIIECSCSVQWNRGMRRNELGDSPGRCELAKSPGRPCRRK
jgi:hypothetical protein